MNFEIFTFDYAALVRIISLRRPPVYFQSIQIIVDINHSSKHETFFTFQSKSKRWVVNIKCINIVCVVWVLNFVSKFCFYFPKLSFQFVGWVEKENPEICILIFISEKLRIESLIEITDFFQLSILIA